MINYYEILGVDRTATADEIKNAYLEKTEFYRSGAYKGTPLQAREKAREVLGAYNMVGDPCERMKYNKLLDRLEQFDRAKAQPAEAQSVSGGAYTIWAVGALLMGIMGVALTGFFQMF